jgi:hypothetical protein
VAQTLLFCAPRLLVVAMRLGLTLPMLLVIAVRLVRPAVIVVVVAGAHRALAHMRSFVFANERAAASFVFDMVEATEDMFDPIEHLTLVAPFFVRRAIGLLRAVLFLVLLVFLVFLFLAAFLLEFLVLFLFAVLLLDLLAFLFLFLFLEFLGFLLLDVLDVLLFFLRLLGVFVLVFRVLTDDRDFLVVLAIMVVVVEMARDVHVDGMRRDAVGDHDQTIFAMRQMIGHMEVRVVDGFAGCDAHCGMVERAAIDGADRGMAPQSHQRIVGRHLLVVAVGAGLRQTVQLPAMQPIGASGPQMSGHMRDLRSPGRFRTAGRGVNLYVVGGGAVIGRVYHLAGRQHQETRVVK